MPVNYKQYPANWKVISYEVRFVKAGGRCQCCNAKHLVVNPYTKKRFVLACVHIDGDRNNCKDNNLGAMCQRCHILHDRPQHNYSRKYGREAIYSTGKLFNLKPRKAKITIRPRVFFTRSLFEAPTGILQLQLFTQADCLN